MDIFVENLKKIQNCLTSPALAKKWGLLSLCRMEYGFCQFVASDHLELDFSFSEIINECINLVCNEKNFDIQKRIRQIDSCYEMLCTMEEQHPETCFCLTLYDSQTMGDLCDYLEFLATGNFNNNIDEFILSAISEDFFIDFHELECIEDFAEHPLVLEEIQRIWEDYKFIQTCTNEQLRKRAEAYQKLNVQAIPENWGLQS